MKNKNIVTDGYIVPAKIVEDKKSGLYLIYEPERILSNTIKTIPPPPPLPIPPTPTSKPIENR